MRHLIPTLFVAAALAAVPATAREKLAPEDQLAKLLEGRVAGKPQNCIPLSTTQSSQIIDKTAIVYRVGSTLWVNRPKGGAESLDDDDILVLKTSGSQLCSIDTLELHDRTSHMYSGFVSLGEFVPYRRAKGE
ncbi:MULTISPECIES: hypothetical protein [unclassified Sphingopyxis]|jgi:hypothetical protein|uniref:hypothetical protein n=1 Tax=unclassified Sphingopyxis TaxID=2614943 RepID=UPI0006BF9B09|nr:MULTISPECIES: hypothetical protein [unclassified Sphingopyxis]USI77098.1 hypothetical protein KEC45_20580 [Sphingopyxis sp. USTB-05]GAO80445.1 hypothetical protein SC1_03770 [Sphingopyxis sp. C-1]